MNPAFNTPHVPMDAIRNQVSRQISMTDNRLNSGELFQAGRELLITHGGDTYRLRLTSQNKLILTK